MTNFSLFLLEDSVELGIFAVLKLKLKDYEYDYRTKLHSRFGWNPLTGGAVSL